MTKNLRVESWWCISFSPSLISYIKNKKNYIFFFHSNIFNKKTNECYQATSRGFTSNI